MADGFDQNEIIEFLANPSTHGGKAVESSDTHSAIIFWQEIVPTNIGRIFPISCVTANARHTSRPIGGHLCLCCWPSDLGTIGQMKEHTDLGLRRVLAEFDVIWESATKSF